MNLFVSPQEREGSEFQGYDGFSVEFREASHRYWIITPPTELRDGLDPERTPAISVTSALNILSKPQLLKWYGKEDAAAAIELERTNEPVEWWDAGGGGTPVLRSVRMRNLEPEKASWLVSKAERGAEGKRDAGADRGTAVHKALAEYCESGVIPSLAGLGDSTRPYVQALASWLLDASPEPLMVEQIVGSPAHGFAGRFDLLANIPAIPGAPALPSGRCLIDCKTGSRAHLYPEASLQMAGYRIAMEKCGIEPPEKSLILCLTDSGTYEVGEAAEADFLAVLGAYRAVSAARKALKNG